MSLSDGLLVSSSEGSLGAGDSLGTSSDGLPGVDDSLETLSEDSLETDSFSKDFKISAISSSVISSVNCINGIQTS